MNFQEIIRQELAALADRIGNTALDIVETGTIRGGGDQYRTGDGWSTVAFAEHVRDHGGTFTSIDLDVSISRAVLAGHADHLDRHVTLVEGHSIRMLAREVAAGSMVDVALLDSDNDAQLILHEYLVVSAMLRRPGVLLVDDVDPDSALVVKGHALVPWLDGEGVTYEITQREAGGYTTGVLIARLDA
jgi:hypothetical protein